MSDKTKLVFVMGGESDGKCNGGCGGSSAILPNPTNADRIRAMTDEELAKFLDGVRIDWYNSHYPLTETGANGWLEWLKQEATE